ncbi:MAG TPA: type II toxin-antitoxin system VapC family toxin [Dehalococcoidia bacterium]|nr:type II toxin-antitoxin system VapC family toxin [Dehalococcoidia bacterium]
MVTDTNILFKVVIREEFSEHAQALYASTLTSSTPIVAPPHWAAELTQALYRLIRRRMISEEEGDQALSQFLQFPVQVIGVPELYQRAFLFARTYIISTYDSLYVMLAEMLETEFWTDDRRLINALAGAAPWVRWIGDYPLSS